MRPTSSEQHEVAVCFRPHIQRQVTIAERHGIIFVCAQMVPRHVVCLRKTDPLRWQTQGQEHSEADAATKPSSSSSSEAGKFADEDENEDETICAGSENHER